MTKKESADLINKNIGLLMANRELYKTNLRLQSERMSLINSHLAEVKYSQELAADLDQLTLRCHELELEIEKLRQDKI